ncbi:MAG: hypothetical protein F4Z57_04680 [Gemmatimonadetes bacterium]|nr:hypothetical protein [Gemmatimonadota bacterium]MYC72946.1 hypothetical protein [Gemmatimonadota bacterium]
MAATIGLRSGSCRGFLLDNEANADRQGSGFNPLCHLSYPDQNLFRDDAVGLNFEHIMNGAAADADRSMFTPRKDRCFLLSHAPGEASVHHPAADSSWGIESAMCYCLGPDCVDMEFTARLTDERCAPLGYVAFMWASYMNRTCGRAIHFYGTCEGEEGWLRFGEDLPAGRFETGTVAHASVDPLPYEEGAETLNIVEDPRKRFLLPFYYGLADGDGDLSSGDDRMVYAMMFDQEAPIRFALWNFIRDERGRPDPHSPAWDWQYVIRTPEIGRTYRYRARLLYRPFVDREAVVRAYEEWASEL